MAVGAALASAPGQEAPQTPPQLAFPAVGAPPHGIVLDESLAPIAGARVSLLQETDLPQPFARATAQRLAATPLPETRTGRDGTFVLPLTEDQRAFGEIRWRSSGCWLVVEAEGHRPWREPIRGGLRSYLGSRVILRTARNGDAFADVPWPPAIVAMRCETSLLPWLPVGDAVPAMSRRGAELPPPAAAESERMATLELRVTAGGAPVPFASVLFEESAYARPAGLPPLPPRVDGEGRLSVRLPPGEHSVRITATGCCDFDGNVRLESAGRGRCDVELRPVEVVDVLAVTPAGVPVPFVRLDVIPKDMGSGERDSFFVFSDSAGRARLWLDEPAEWFVYGDFGATAERFPLERERAGDDGVFRVTKKRPVTVRLRGDEWPKRGNLHWHGDGGAVVMRAFEFEAIDAGAVVFRMCPRDDAMTIVAGDSGVPFVFRRDDLPPMPSEPLLDLVELDRRLRLRGTVVPRSTSGAQLRRVSVRPSWQADMPFARRAMEFSRREADAWQLFARDDTALDLVAVAAGHRPAPFTVPARVDGAELPVVPVALEPR